MLTILMMPNFKLVSFGRISTFYVFEQLTHPIPVFSGPRSNYSLSGWLPGIGPFQIIDPENGLTGIFFEYIFRTDIYGMARVILSC